MIVKAYVRMGLVGCKITDEIEIDDEDLEGLSEDERENLIGEYVQDWIWNHVEYGWDE